MSNLTWLASTLRFTLLLDQVSEDLEPAYRLRELFEQGTAIRPEAIAVARKRLESAPLDALFSTYMGRVRSRGELGVMSSMNQKLWLQYVELKEFLDSSALSYPGNSASEIINNSGQIQEHTLLPVP